MFNYTFQALFRLIPVIILYIVLGINPAFCQSPEFKNYDIKDGVPSSEVYNVFQDSKGYLWFSTDHGVSKFDGYHFENFSTANGLADNLIFESFEDYKGRIWFKSFSGMLSYYYQDSIYKLPINEKLRALVNLQIVASVSVDSTDKIYMSIFANNKGIIRIDMRDKFSIRYFPLPNDISYVAEPGKGAKLVYGNTKTPSITINNIINYYSYNLQPSAPGLIEQFHLQLSLAYTDFRVYHENAVRMPGGEIAISFGRHFVVFKGDKVVFSQDFEKQVMNLCVDRSGKVWIIQDGREPYTYSNGRITYYPCLKFLADKFITSLCVDNEGGIWFTSHNRGIYYLSSLSFITLAKGTGLPGTRVNNVFISPHNQIWLSIDNNQVAILSKDTVISCSFPQYVVSSPVTSVLFKKDGTVWTSGYDRINIFKNEYSLEMLPIKVTMNGKGPGMIEDSNGSVWTNSINHLIELERNKDSVKIIKDITFHDRITAFCKIDSIFWLGTGRGLAQLVADSLNFSNAPTQLLKDRIRSIMYRNSRFYIDTYEDGIEILYKNKCLRITVKDGLLSNFCHCMNIDYKGRIWVGTSTGLSMIVTDTDKEGNSRIKFIRNISQSNLFEINHIATIKDTLYAATNNCLTIFNIDSLQSNKVPPPVYITSFKINNKEIPLNGQDYNFPYNENYVKINYVGLTYKDAGNTLYKYKLVGADTGWTYGRYTSVQYPKLPPGHYTFCVSASNNDGVWSKETALVSFNIAQPIWGIWWIKAIFIALLFAGLYLFMRRREKRNKKEMEIKRQMVIMELQQLKKQTDPHFLFNSLNTLTFLIETQSKDSVEFIEELSNFYRYTISSRASELMDLDSEIKQAKRYVNLLKIRFDKRLSVKWKVHETNPGFFIPTFTLQLLIENSIKHNMATDEKPLIIEITNTKNNTLLVKNNLQQRHGEVKSTGFGLASISERYRLLRNEKINIVKSKEYFSVELPLLKEGIPKQ